MEPNNLQKTSIIKKLHRLCSKYASDSVPYFSQATLKMHFLKLQKFHIIQDH